MTKLFRHEIQAQDIIYAKVRDDPRNQKHKDFTESLWARYEPYADKQFQQEIPRRFHQRFWEMYLACILMDQGFQLATRKTKAGPDLCLNVEGTQVWIEAVAPSSGTGQDAAHEPINDSFMVLDEPVILRYISVLEEKRQKYLNYQQRGLIGEQDPYVIAVNGRDVEMSFLGDHEDDVPYIVKSVLGIGDEQFTLDLNTKEVTNQGYARRTEIIKQSGSSVRTDIFLREEYSGISGIIYCGSNIANRPEQMGTELMFVHNPTASFPLEKGWLPIGLEFFVKDGYLIKLNRNQHP